MNGPNKLENFFLEAFQPSLMFEGKAKEPTLEWSNENGVHWPHWQTLD